MLIKGELLERDTIYEQISKTTLIRLLLVDEILVGGNLSELEQFLVN